MEIWMFDLRSVRYLWCWWGLHWKIKPQLSHVSYIYHCDDTKSQERQEESENVLVFCFPLVLLNMTSQAQPQMFTLKLFFVFSRLSSLHPGNQGFYTQRCSTCSESESFPNFWKFLEYLQCSVFRVCISYTRKVARSVLVQLALHNSGPNTEISFK